MAVKKTPRSTARTSAKPRAGTAGKTPTAAKANAGQAARKTGARAEETFAHAKAKVEQTSAAALNGYDELAVLGKGNFDALVKSNTAVAKGFETLGLEVMAFAQRSVEENMAQARALIGARDLQEFVSLQNVFAQQRMEVALAETARFTEISAKVANEAMEPLKNRVDAAVETVLKAQAA